MVRRYVPGVDDDEYIASYGPEGRRYLFADERGSIIAAADDSGNAAQILTYDEFGIPASTNALRFQYTGASVATGGRSLPLQGASLLSNLRAVHATRPDRLRRRHEPL